VVIGLSAGDKLKAWSGDQIVVDKDQSGKLRSDTLLLATCFSVEKAFHSTRKVGIAVFCSAVRWSIGKNLYMVFFLQFLLFVRSFGPSLNVHFLTEI
jgi:hypothetical protein